MAIDVNYTTNPFISASANKVFDRANKQLGRSVKTFQNNMTYDEIAELDKLLVDYFALATDPATRRADQEADPGRSSSSSPTSGSATSPRQKAAIEAGGLLDLDKRLVEEIGLRLGRLLRRHHALRHAQQGQRREDPRRDRALQDPEGAGEAEAAVQPRTTRRAGEPA